MIRTSATRSAFSLSRTRSLLAACRHEQENPDAFYRPLAQDTVTLVSRWTETAGRVILDVGGGPGYFAEAFEETGARCLSVEYSVTELLARETVHAGALIGDGQALPFRDGAVDICFSSNVLEHVPRPDLMLSEMVRVTAPGGLVFLAYTNWLGPLGGHETSPWHYLGGEYAARRYQRRTGKPPKNRYGVSLFPLSVGRVLHWVRRAERSGAVTALAVLPRYHPWWAQWIVRVPGLREVLTANCVIVLRKR
jgi:SAM-dependent methyltransferase